VNKAERRRHKARKRQRDDRQQQADRALEARKPVEFLKRIGMWQVLKRYRLIEQLAALRGPPAQVRLANDTLPSPTTEMVLRELRAAIKDTRVDFSSPPCSVSAQDYVTVVAPVAGRLSTWHPSDLSLRKAAFQARASAQPFVSKETFRRYGVAVWKNFYDVLIKHSRITHDLYYLTSYETSNRCLSHNLAFELHRQPSASLRIEVDGKGRLAYRCGLPEVTGLKWVEWDSGVLGVPDHARRLPVYVQQHVLDHLYGPRARIPIVKHEQHLLHAALCESLNEPVITRIRPGDPAVLVQYSLHGHKCGYLVARLVSDRVLVQTFLLLTMEGTPESARLREKLGVARTDRSFLGLDSLLTFIGTDVMLDPELSTLLRSCGCDGLFEAFETGSLPREGVARGIREYLGLASSGEPGDGTTHRQEARDK